MNEREADDRPLSNRANYVVQNYSSRLSAGALHALIIRLCRFKQADQRPEHIARKEEESLREIERLRAEGKFPAVPLAEALELEVERLLRERPGDIVLNACPRCGYLVATPKARQCLACGNDWH